MRQLPYDGANQQVQKVRLSPSQPLITAPLLANTVCTSFSHLSSTFFSDIMQLYNANIRSKGDDDRWTEPFCTATATRFSRVWKRCSTRRSPMVRPRSAVIRRAATASFSPRTRRPKPSAYKLPRPSGRRNGNARIYGW